MSKFIKIDIRMINIDSIQEISYNGQDVFEITFKNGKSSQYKGSYALYYEILDKLSSMHTIYFTEDRRVDISVVDISTIDYEKNKIKIMMKGGEQINGTITDEQYSKLLCRVQ